MPKCEIFDLFDFNGDFRDEIKKLFFLNVGQIRTGTILSLLAYVQCTLATIFDLELAQKKIVSDSFEIHLKVSK